MLFRDIIQYIAMLLIVAGLVIYGLKRVGYIEGMESKDKEVSNDIIKESAENKRTIIN